MSLSGLYTNFLQEIMKMLVDTRAQENVRDAKGRQPRHLEKILLPEHITLSNV